MANYYYKSIVDGHHWKLLVMDGFGKGICEFNFPSFTTDKLTGTLLPDATLVDTGIMKNIHDTQGMQSYLRNNDWIHDDDVLLPWSEDRIEKPVIEYGERITRAKESDLVLLPENIEGANCFNCRFINKSSALHGFCQNPKVAQIVTVRMCCCFWDAEGTKRIADMLMNGEDEFEKGGQIELPKESFYVEFAPYDDSVGKEKITAHLKPNTDSTGFHTGYSVYGPGDKKLGFINNTQLIDFLRSGEYKIVDAPTKKSPVKKHSTKKSKQ